MTRTSNDLSIQRLAARLVGLERQVRGLSLPSLSYSAIEGGGLDLRDKDGNLIGRVGELPDGSGGGVLAISGPAPAKPSKPILTPIAGGLGVTWDGVFADGTTATAGYSRMEIHVGTTSGFYDGSAGFLRATIESPRGGTVAVVPLAMEVKYVVFVARSTSGKASVVSEQATATPGSVISQAELDAINADLAANNTAINQLNTDLAAANVELDAAGVKADQALVTANGKGKIYNQPTAPASGTEFDIWFDTDDGNKPYRWDKTLATPAWVEASFGSAALANLAITAEKVAANAITVAKIADGAIEAAKIATNAVGETHLAALAVTAAKVADNAITTAKIVDGAITAAEIATGAVTSAKVGFAIGGGNLSPDSSFEVDTNVDGIADGWDGYSNTANGQTWSLTTPGRTGGKAQRVTWTATNTSTKGVSKAFAFRPDVDYVISYYARSSLTAPAPMDLRWSGGHALTQSAIVNPVVGTSWTRHAWRVRWTGTTADPRAYISITDPNGGTGWIEYDDFQIEEGDVLTAYAPKPDEILPGTITSTEIADGSITTPKIVTGAVVAGTIAAGAIETDKLAANAITAAKIAANTITAAQIAVGTITAAEIAANTITAAKIAVGAITATEIAANTITAAKIAVGTITANEIAADTITGAKIAAGTITAAEIAANTITAAKIAVGTITANEIAADTITGAKIAANTITAGEMVAGTITVASGIIGSLDAGKVTTGTMSATHITAGSITTDRMTANTINGDRVATNTLNADRIVANTITAGKIAAGTLTSASGVFGEISANNITTGTLSADRISGGTINGQTISGGTISGSTITGATFQTATSAQRISISGAGTDTIFFYNTSGVISGRILGGSSAITPGITIHGGDTTAGAYIAINSQGIMSRDTNSQKWAHSGILNATTLQQGGTAVIIEGDTRLTNARNPTAHSHNSAEAPGAVTSVNGRTGGVLVTETMSGQRGIQSNRPGYASTTTSIVDVPVTFPAAYGTNATVVISPLVSGDNPMTQRVLSASTTAFTARFQRDGSTTAMVAGTLCWIATG